VSSQGRHKKSWTSKTIFTCVCQFNQWSPYSQLNDEGSIQQKDTKADHSKKKSVSLCFWGLSFIAKNSLFFSYFSLTHKSFFFYSWVLIKALSKRFLCFEQIHPLVETMIHLIFGNRHLHHSFKRNIQNFCFLCACSLNGGNNLNSFTTISHSIHTRHFSGCTIFIHMFSWIQTCLGYNWDTGKRT